MVMVDPIEEAVLAWVHGIVLVFDRNQSMSHAATLGLTV